MELRAKLKLTVVSNNSNNNSYNVKKLQKLYFSTSHTRHVPTFQIYVRFLATLYYTRTKVYKYYPKYIAAPVVVVKLEKFPTLFLPSVYSLFAAGKITGSYSVVMAG